MNTPPLTFPSLEIRLDRTDPTYLAGETVSGVVRVSGPLIGSGHKVQVGDTEVYASTFIKGSGVQMFEAIWRLRPVDTKTTELSLEVFLHPDAPLPTSVINNENVKGAAKGVAAMRDRAEGKPTPPNP